MNLFPIQLCWNYHWLRMLHFTMTTLIICICNQIFKGKKEREVCLDTHQYGKLLRLCEMVSALLFLTEIHHTLSQLFNTFPLRRKHESSTKPYSQHTILLAWHKAWDAIGYFTLKAIKSYEICTHSFSIISEWGCCKREASAASLSRGSSCSSKFGIDLSMSSWYRGFLPSLILLIS